MTILALLIGLLASHFATGFVRVRDYRWLMQPPGWLRGLDPASPWLPAAAVFATAIVFGWLASGLITLLWGTPGWLALATLTVIYTLGPRDLDRDVRLLIAGGDTKSAAEAREALQLHPTATGSEAAAAVLHASRARWFGIIFWFTVLGIPGALLYRLTRVANHAMDLDDAERGRMEQLRFVLDWPVIALMMLSVAMTADFDRILQSWRQRDDKWRMEPAMLDRAASELLLDTDPEDGLMHGWRLAWRVLVLWLVVLSLLLLVGLLS